MPNQLTLTTDVLNSLTADSDYRRTVIQNIDYEIKMATNELASLEKIVGWEQEICLALDRIRYLEDVIRDGGGWKNSSQWWYASNWSRTKPSSDLQADRKSVYRTEKRTRTTTDSDGNTSTTTYYVKVFDHYKYKKKIRDDAAIASAIKAQENLIDRLNGGISTAVSYTHLTLPTIQL